MHESKNAKESRSIQAIKPSGIQSIGQGWKMQVNMLEVILSLLFTEIPHF